MTTKTSKYGTITENREDFGYGMVWVDNYDGRITYQDACGYKSWKTVGGFERWADKQNAINGGVYQTIGASSEPTYEEDTEEVETEKMAFVVVYRNDSDAPCSTNIAFAEEETDVYARYTGKGYEIISVSVAKSWELEEMRCPRVTCEHIDNSKPEETEEPQATEEGATVNGNVVTVFEDGRVFEYRIERAASGNWFEYMYMDGEYCGDWTGKRCIYGVKTDAPWIRDPYRLGGKIHLTPEMIQALRNAQAAA